MADYSCKHQKVKRDAAFNSLEGIQSETLPETPAQPALNNANRKSLYRLCLHLSFCLF